MYILMDKINSLINISVFWKGKLCWIVYYLLVYLKILYMKYIIFEINVNVSRILCFS